MMTGVLDDCVTVVDKFVVTVTWMSVVSVLLQLLATMSPFRLLSPLRVGS